MPNLNKFVLLKYLLPVGSFTGQLGSFAVQLGLGLVLVEVASTAVASANPTDFSADQPAPSASLEDQIATAELERLGGGSRVETPLPAVLPVPALPPSTRSSNAIAIELPPPEVDPGFSETSLLAPASYSPVNISVSPPVLVPIGNVPTSSQADSRTENELIAQMSRQTPVASPVPAMTLPVLSPSRPTPVFNPQFQGAIAPPALPVPAFPSVITANPGTNTGFGWVTPGQVNSSPISSQIGSLSVQPAGQIVVPWAAQPSIPFTPSPVVSPTASSSTNVGFGLVTPGQVNSLPIGSQIGSLPVQPPGQFVVPWTAQPSVPFTSPPASPGIISSSSPMVSQSSLTPAPIFVPPPVNSGVPVQSTGLPVQSTPPPTDLSTPPPPTRPLLSSAALTPPSLQLQGVYLYQNDESSARARLSAVYPLTPNVLVGGILDLTSGNALGESEGLNLTELYVATSLQGLPNLRFVIGQIDLTSYFDRNSFAKDSTTQFFNPIFQTNPALSQNSVSSRTAALVNWSLTDNLEARAAVFSSARNIGDFALDGFAGEIGLRAGNAIVRGTYISSRDTNLSGNTDSDRQEAYGVNAELFVPELSLGIFGRYGQRRNYGANTDQDTFSGGVNFLDVFAPNDRLGIAYGRNLSDEGLRRQTDARTPDALELFYDFRAFSNLRLGVTIQQINEFSETIAGVRVRTEFDVTPRGRLGQ